jgi:hypothetical protein
MQSLLLDILLMRCNHDDAHSVAACLPAGLKVDQRLQQELQEVPPPGRLPWEQPASGKH